MIKFIFRWGFRLLVLLIVLAVALVLLKDTLTKSFAENRLRKETGLEVKLGKFEVGLGTPTITIENLVIYNSADFGGGVFLDIPDLRLEYDLAAFRNNRLHLKLLRLNMREFNVVENQAGRTNYIVLLERTKAGKKDDGENKSPMPFDGIDVLNLSLGEVRMTSMKNPQNNTALPLRLTNEIVRNVKSEADLMGVALKVALRTGITLMNTPSSNRSVFPLQQMLRPRKK